MRCVAPTELGRVRLWSSTCLLIAFLAFGAAAASDGGAFDSLLGSWTGSGRVTFDDGQSESVKCAAYYSGGGTKLRLAIRCASSSAKIEIRGLLEQEKDAVIGTWEERTFNASGDAKGRVAGNGMRLSISGGGFSGSMSVSFDGSSQAVAISTEGIQMKSVNVTLSRS